MSKLHCIICSNKSMPLLKSIKTFKNKKLTKLIEIFGGVRVVKSKKKFSPSICKDCFHGASVAYNFYKKCQDQSVKTRLSRFSEEKIKLKSQTVSSQTEPQRFMLIMNQIPKDLFSEKFSEDQLKSMFCEYGTISDLYLSEINFYREGCTRITFFNEQASINTWEAIRDKIKEAYDDKVATTLISENDSPINILPDDCLQRIFLFLSEFDDKMNIEKVCQRWQELAPINWINLKLLEEFDCRDRSCILTIDKWEEILMYSKRSLKEIDIDVSHNVERQFKGVEKNCENLESMAIKYYMGPPEEFVEYLKSLFTAKQKLQRLLIKDIYSRCDFGFLNNLSENMVEIHFYAEHRNPNRSCSQMDFSTLRNLRVLELYSFEFSYEDSLSGLENLVNLEYFVLIDSSVHSRTFEKMQNLTKLEHLEIPSQIVHDDVLSMIVRNNRNLRSLDISNNLNMLNNTLRTIGELQKLSELTMKNLHNFDGSFLSKLHKLRWLDCRGCSSITDWDLMTLIDRAPNLWTIIATGCNVTLRMLVSAGESIKKREIMDGILSIKIANQKLIDTWSKMPDKSDRIDVCRKDDDSSDYDRFEWDDWVSLD